MIVPDGWYEIMDALKGAVLTTPDIRGVIKKDPHPTLGRMRDMKVVELEPSAYWALTDLGYALLEVGRLER